MRSRARSVPEGAYTWGAGSGKVTGAVQQRYSAAARHAEPGLCCPVEFDSAYLQVIPPDVLERDYGCGDPVSHVRAGETVLDLGCGCGKVCFIAAQVVGPKGHVIGVDANHDMLDLARTAQHTVAERLGYSNVAFVKARIEDLGLDLEFLDEHLMKHPITRVDDLVSLQAHVDQLRAGSPVVADDSVDVVISNCVLNLVNPAEKRHMFAEITRVLRPGGRAVISDIVADRDVPLAMQTDPDLWSGCYSGAMRHDLFLGAFVEAGLHGVTVLKRDSEPWQTIEGVEFRSVTVAAYKPPVSSSAAEASLAVLYTGPFTSVTTDSGQLLERGVPVQVSHDEVAALGIEPYRSQIQLLEGAGTPDQPAAVPLSAPLPACDTPYRTDPPTTEGQPPSCGCEP